MLPSPFTQKCQDKKHLQTISTRIGISLLSFNLIALLLTFSCSIGLSLLSTQISSQSFALRRWILSETGQQFLSLIFTVGAEVLVIYILAKSLHFDLRRLFHPLSHEHGGAYAAKGAFWFLGVNILVSFVTSWFIFFIQQITGIIPYSPNLTTPSPTEPTAMVISILMSVVTAPILEEILFRGIILRSLQRFGNLFAIAVSSCLFGLWHGNMSQAIPLIAASMILGLVAIRTDSVLPCIIIHALNNAVLTIFDLLGYYLTDALLDSLYFMVVVVVILFGFAFLLLSYHNLKIKDYNISGVHGADRLSYLILAPGMLLFLVYLILQYIGTFL